METGPAPEEPSITHASIQDETPEPLASSSQRETDRISNVSQNASPTNTRLSLKEALRDDSSEMADEDSVNTSPELPQVDQRRFNVRPSLSPSMLMLDDEPVLGIRRSVPLTGQLFVQSNILSMTTQEPIPEGFETPEILESSEILETPEILESPEDPQTSRALETPEVHDTIPLIQLPDYRSLEVMALRSENPEFHQHYRHGSRISLTLMRRNPRLNQHYRIASIPVPSPVHQNSDTEQQDISRPIIAPTVYHILNMTQRELFSTLITPYTPLQNHVLEQQYSPSSRIVSSLVQRNSNLEELEQDLPPSSGVPLSTHQNSDSDQEELPQSRGIPTTLLQVSTSDQQYRPASVFSGTRVRRELGRPPRRDDRRNQQRDPIDALLDGLDLSRLSGDSQGSQIIPLPFVTEELEEEARRRRAELEESPPQTMNPNGGQDAFQQINIPTFEDYNQSLIDQNQQDWRFDYRGGAGFGDSFDPFMGEETLRRYNERQQASQGPMIEESGLTRLETQFQSPQQTQTNPDLDHQPEYMNGEPSQL